MVTFAFLSSQEFHGNSPLNPFTQRPPYPRKGKREKVLHPCKQDRHVTDWIPYTPGLTIRPAAWIVQELPPSFRIPCHPFLPRPRIYGSCFRVEYDWEWKGEKKPLEQTPVEKHQPLLEETLPHSGSEPDLTVFTSLGFHT